jgi:hypothetical protein
MRGQRSGPMAAVAEWMWEGRRRSGNEMRPEVMREGIDLYIVLGEITILSMCTVLGADAGGGQ